MWFNFNLGGFAYLIKKTPFLANIIIHSGRIVNLSMGQIPDTTKGLIKRNGWFSDEKFLFNHPKSD